MQLDLKEREEMKILYVTTISDTVNAFLIPHIHFLVKQGHEVGVAFNIVQDVDPRIDKLGCKVHPIDFQRNPLSKGNFQAYKRIKAIITEGKYEVVHVHTPVASFLTRLASKNIHHVKVLYTAHGFHFFRGAPKKNWAIYYPLEKMAARWTDGLITMNDEDFYSARKLNLRNSNAIYKIRGIGLDTSKFYPPTAERKRELRSEYGYHSRDFILIYVGELSYRKHQDLLIESISMLNEEKKNLKLLLVGEGDYLEKYRDLVSRLGVEQNVEFLGYRKDIHQLMALSDVAISTSRQEGLPVNVMEAMSTGLPVIVTDCRGNRDLVKSGKNGFVVGVDDTMACAHAIKILYNSNELREIFSDENRKLIQQYSLENVIDDMKEIYSKQLEIN
jgi:glycosyltransferase EpsD